VLVVVLIGGDWDCGRGTDEGLGRESTREAMMRDPYPLLSSGI
jgi:hypothetical protein